MSIMCTNTHYLYMCNSFLSYGRWELDLTNCKKNHLRRLSRFKLALVVTL